MQAQVGLTEGERYMFRCTLNAAIAALLTTVLASPASVAAETGNVILGAGGFWRAHVTWREGVTTESKPFGAYQKMTTPPPPDGWMQPDFDDSSWFRAPGPFQGKSIMNNAYMPQQMRLMSGCLALRGKFRVDNPAAVTGLTLSLEFRGGVVVYLNGKEIARAHLPKGKLLPQTPANAYPSEVYVNSKGKLIPSSEYGLVRSIKAGNADLRERVAKRERKLGPVEIPTKLLRKGVNVLAVANHSSDYRPPAAKWGRDRGCKHGWYHLGVHRLLLVTGGGGCAPNIARPEGVQVWNQDINRIFTAAEYGDPNEKLRPVRLVGARNGRYSGQVVVSSTSAIAGINAVASDLKGPGTIPAANVQMRYASLSAMWAQGKAPGQNPRVYRYGKNPPAFIALQEEPPAQVEPASVETNPKIRTQLGLPAKVTPAALIPVWITVKIPRDAPPGKYSGELTVTANGIPATKVPLKVEVIDWTLPDPTDYRFFVGIYQSPETLALQYKVPRWSEQHWKLIEKSWQLLGELGNNLVVVHLLTRTQYGNEESMITWAKQPDGTYKYDYTNFDRYIKLAVKYCTPRKISLQTLHAVEDWGLVKAADPRFVTGVDKTGKRSALKLPGFVTEEAAKALTPVLEGVRERLKKQKLEKTLVMGMLSDQGIRPEIGAWFKKVFPGVKWHYGAHSRPRYPYLSYAEYLYVPHLIAPPGGKRKYYWWTPNPRGITVVMSQRLSDSRQGPVVVRTLAERALILGDEGPGRICLDYWPVLKGKRKMMDLFNRWPNSTVGQRRPCLTRLSLPGPRGALGSVKTEALREGNQEAEARAFIEEMLFVKKKISGDLAERCRKLLDARVNLCRTVHSNYSQRRAACDAGWQASSAELYQLAAEVAKASGAGTGK